MLTYRNPFTVLVLVTLPAYLCGQDYTPGRYADLDLYHSLLRAEQRDSTYAKTLYAWNKAQEDIPEDHLTFAVNNNALAAEYRSLVSSEKTSYKIVQTDKLMELASRAAEKGEYCLELNAMIHAFRLAFRGTPHDHSKAFGIALMLEEHLPKVDETFCPCKRKIYFELGEAHYIVLDFHKSIELLKKALSPEPLSFDDRANLDALRTLGLCYVGLNRWKLSDDYFRAILLSGDLVMDRPYYNACAISSMGCNAMFTGDYNKVLEFSAAAWKTLRETDDNGQTAATCYCCGRSYLRKREYKEAAAWIDSLTYFAARDNHNKAKRTKQIYTLRAEYYAAMGDARLAQAYNDTLVNIYKNENAGFTYRYIMQAAKDHHTGKIRERDIRLKKSRTRLVLVSMLALLSVSVAAEIVYLYRRKQADYKALAQKAQEWASNAGSHPASDVSASVRSNTGKAKSNDAIQEDYDIMSLLDEEMTVKHLYREPGLTLEALADRMGIHRNVLSRAINKVYGGNFCQYINGFRVKEAVNIMTWIPYHDLRIDEIYEQAGFNNRTSFYRTFRQMTGLSPSEFKRNKK